MLLFGYNPVLIFNFHFKHSNKCFFRVILWCTCKNKTKRKTEMEHFYMTLAVAVVVFHSTEAIGEKTRESKFRCKFLREQEISWAKCSDLATNFWNFSRWAVQNASNYSFSTIYSLNWFNNIRFSPVEIETEIALTFFLLKLFVNKINLFLASNVLTLKEELEK